MTLKVNDTVELNPASGWVRGGSTPTNPLGVQGTVVEVVPTQSDSLNIRVLWSNGSRNSYRVSDLMLKSVTAPVDPKEVAKEKLKYKRYTDMAGDSFKVDSEYSAYHVSFEPKDDKENVILDVKQVIALRKQLKHWLVANGHNKGE